jgi:hypothetical protein
MKLRIWVLMILAVFCFGVVSVCAEEAKKEPAKDQLFYLMEFVVSPSTVAEYEKAQKAFSTAAAQHNYSVGYTAYSTNDFHYYYIIPIDNFAGIDALMKEYEGFIQKMGQDNFQKLMKGFDGTYKYMREGVSKVSSDYSYMPADPRVKPEEAPYIYWNAWYIKAGMEDEIAEVWKEYKKLYEKNNLKDGWHMWVGILGSDSPAHVGALFGKSDVDFFTRFGEIDKALGEQGQALWNKALSMCRKFEQRYGRPRPDLSYVPKKETPKQ